MKTLRILPLAAIAVSLSATAFAQNSANPQEGMTEKPASLQQNDSSATAPQNAGSTGWTGGAGGSFIGTDQHGTAASPNSQPEMATGADLNGPPTRFPTNGTPE